MKAVSDLDGLRGTIPGALGKETMSVAADDLHRRVRPQPLGRAGGGAIWQDIYNRPALQIHHDRPVAPTLAPGPIIDPDDMDGSAAVLR